MAECAHCGAFTDNGADGESHYYDDCLSDFATIEQSGVVVEQATEGGAYHLIITDRDASLDG
ncbi:hypothetical protein ACM16X_16710 [Haloarcula japonica]|uniref:hypothetical protein n=1 Tax=Haloarcula japonica TaxID=29282 RepID=UPI0039F7421C